MVVESHKQGCVEVDHLVGEDTLGHLVVVHLVVDNLEEDNQELPLVEERNQAGVVHSQAVVDSQVVADSPLVEDNLVEGDNLVGEGSQELLQDSRVELEARHQVAGYTMEHEMYNKHKDVSKLSDRHNHTNHHLHREAFPIGGFCVRKLRNSYDIKQEYRRWLHM